MRPKLDDFMKHLTSSSYEQESRAALPIVDKLQLTGRSSKL
jgi:hypothetical protein